MPAPSLLNNRTKVRNSNLELYRIICMLMIVAHHYVVNSGLTHAGGPLVTDYTTGNSYFLAIFGAWGKTGINCFLMITGYYMCSSAISLRKYIKLLLQIYFYQWVLFPILLVCGYESLAPSRLIRLLLPLWGVSKDFVGCFVIFYLMIPFLTILVKSLNKK